MHERERSRFSAAADLTLRDVASPLSPGMRKWKLSTPTEIAQTPTSAVYRVRLPDGGPAVLKCLTPVGVADERRGAALLEWWNGDGAVRLIAADETAHLLSYIDGGPLSDLVHAGQDEAATSIICEVVGRLHKARGAPPAGLIPMDLRWRSLFEKAAADRQTRQATLFVDAARRADALLKEGRKWIPLHGDLHHDNILHCSTHGWLAIDPKGVRGDPCYDVANIFCNPVGAPEITGDGRRVDRLADRFAEALGQERARILDYAFVHAALSAAWSLSDGDDPDPCLDVAALLLARVTSR